jgi:integrase
LVMADEAVRWRLGSKARAAGRYWFLESGRGENRRSLSLGYLTEAEARKALETMNREEDRTAGTPQHGRILRMHEHDAEKAIEVLVEDRIQDLGGDTVDYGALTVAAYFDEVFWPVRSDSRTDIGVAESTAKAEGGYWRHKEKGQGILETEIGWTRMRDLTDQHWVRFEEAQTHLSGRSKALRRAAYAALLSYARKKGHITLKPEFFRIKGATKRTREQSDPLSLEEVLKLMEVAAKDPQPIRAGTRRAMWAVGAGLGLRPGELARVEWQDVDWETRTLVVRGTKTEESADTIPMTPLAWKGLRELWELLGQPEQGRCFRHHGKAFKDFRKALKEDAEDADSHALPAAALVRDDRVVDRGGQGCGQADPAAHGSGDARQGVLQAAAGGPGGEGGGVRRAGAGEGGVRVESGLRVAQLRALSTSRASTCVRLPSGCCQNGLVEPE